MAWSVRHLAGLERLYERQEPLQVVDLELEVRHGAERSVSAQHPLFQASVQRVERQGRRLVISAGSLSEKNRIHLANPLKEARNRGCLESAQY